MYRLLWKYERRLAFVGIFTVPISLCLSALALFTPSAILSVLETSNRFSYIALVIVGLLLAKLLCDLINSILSIRISNAEYYVLRRMEHMWTARQRDRDWYLDFEPDNNVYLEELYAYLDLPNDMYKGTLAVEKRDDNDYEIEFRDVSFKYPRTETWVLRHVSMKFKIGDKLAIVGENGSGKTTFIKLLCRLYDPTEGKILLNGIDITRYRYDEYMALFSVVFQDFTLFAFPLGEVVAADHTYDPAKVRDCLIRAGMGDKLADLDNDLRATEKDALKRAIGRDYDREGIDFSGGEMQKIALARALYKDAPFVILDEPTAALDPIAEAAVYENFNELVKDKTAVFISHRLSSCRFCDHIAVFDHGQMIQHGSHDELLADERNKYYELWHAQAQYYTEQGAT